ncbi:DUF559 domain-containing protein, partial [Candidatus Dojkabacteria bacterium]|nr:DUF559 domain-containing protein [Candidatus Dojkabacteria bacterium]
MKLNYLYNKKLKSFARENKKDSTYGEAKLWKHLRNSQLLGYKFRRQYSTKNFILDFYCHKLKLCIEIDGTTHADKKVDQDMLRDKALKKKGIHTLRFSEYDVLKNIND